METIGERIRQLRKDNHLTLDEFGGKIGISSSSVSYIESGKNNPAPRTVLLICREFGVSEMWLRTGEGEMYPQRGRLDELSYMAGRFLSSEPTEFQQRFAMMMYSLTDEEWKLLEQKARMLLDDAGK